MLALIANFQANFADELREAERAAINSKSDGASIYEQDTEQDPNDTIPPEPEEFSESMHLAHQ
jgi:hypothetical protein